MGKQQSAVHIVVANCLGRCCLVFLGGMVAVRLSLILPMFVLPRSLHPDLDWRRIQADLLRRSSRSEQHFAIWSGHNIQLGQPEAAVGAIVKMVERVRG